MSISAADVNKLRQMTGAGMMDCKKALTEANGDFEAAIDILRKKGQKVSAARADRETKEGAVFIHTTADGKTATLIALGCETDFVARNDDFQALGTKILETAAAGSFASIEELNAAAIEGRPISDHLTDIIGKIGEKIEVVGFEKISGDRVTSYIHSNGKLGVLVGFTGVNGTDVTELGKDVAMQIAAMRPVALDKDDVDQATIERELEIAKEQVRAEGKPEEMVEKIATGKLNKFFKESTLLNQEFVKDNSKTIAQVVSSYGKDLKINGFKRVAIGA